MIQNLSFAAVVSVSLWLPTQVFAGGPPFLSLPIEGVTAENAEACRDLLNSKLASKSNAFIQRLRGVTLVEQGNQWYLALYMGEDVRLTEVTAALKESGFAVPQDRLTLFGRVMLEIGAPASSEPDLIAALDALPHLSVDEKKSEQDRLLITVDMPYPIEDGRPDLESIGWKEFRLNDFNSNQAQIARVPVMAEELPTYQQVKDVVAKHSGTLHDLRWNADHACRPLGAAVRPESKAKVAVKVEGR